MTRYIDEESEWSGSHGPEVQRGFSQGWALPQLSFTAGLRRMLRRLSGHLAAYLPGFPEGLVHCRLLPHTGPGRLSTICLGHSVAGVVFLSSPQHPSRVLWNILSLSPPQAEEKELPRGCAHLPPRPRLRNSHQQPLRAGIIVQIAVIQSSSPRRRSRRYFKCH